MRDIDIHGYANSDRKGQSPRRPLVHLITTHYGDVQSITFHPDDAPAIAKAIVAAAKAATRGRTVKKTVPLLLTED
jgi:hypothetical protein